MRLFAFVILTLTVLMGPAAADQTDPRLRALFEKLRTGPGERSESLAQEINAIWTRSASPTVNLLIARAQASMDARHFDVAEALLDHAIGLSPHFAQAYALRGAARLRLDDQDGAITDFSRAIELEPRQYEARIALAEIMMAGGDKRGAYDMFQKALEWNPHEKHARARARKLRDEIDGQEI